MMKAFISHSSVDKKFVRRLKIDLNHNNIQTWVDEDELTLGDNLSDKLEEALEKSTHFLIILSPLSIQSTWVKMELELALSHLKAETMRKIIPIKYSPCEVPEKLSKLLYADLSKEVRKDKGDKVEFLTQGYDDFLIRLTKSLETNERWLSKEDKIILKSEVKKEKDKDKENFTFIQGNYAVLGYLNLQAKKNYIEKISNANSSNNLRDFKPVLLPPLLKFIFPDLKLGSPIYFSRNFTFNEIGHFAGYRSNDLYITVDSFIRKNIGIEKGRLYKVEINVHEPRINFIKRVI